tara:strand:- start:131 stop:439 length:309 start_codon:yes stop_codon:yes gene_type:complete
MSKIHYIEITKVGSNWNSADDCQLELAEAISKLNITNDFKTQLENMGRKYKAVLSGQVYSETNSIDDFEYTQYKNNISEYEASIEQALVDLGWVITETVRDV